MQPPEPTPPKRGFLTGGRALVVLALAVLVPVVAGIAVWQAGEEHQVLPGLGGCGKVRERTAQMECYTDEFRELVREDGRQGALAAVDREAKGSVTLTADCHLAWHPVGEEDGARDAKADDGYDNIAARTTCQQGYSHGYTIGFMGAREPTMDELVQIVRDECGGSTGLNALFNCTHSYGHVIARRFRDDVPAAIEACAKVDYESLPGADAKSPVPGEEPPVLVGAEHQCYYGLYMEIGLLDAKEGVTKLDNCDTATTPKARKSCYAFLSSRVNGIQGDLPAAARACHELAPIGDLRDSCVKTFSLGMQDATRCSYLVAKVEQAQCRRIIEIREGQEDLLEFASGDPDSLEANVRIAPEPGVDAPDDAPDAPDVAPPGGA